MQIILSKCLIGICTRLQESCALSFRLGCTSAHVVRINWQLCQQSCMV